MTRVPEGACCGCDCGCLVPLTDGNVMTEDVTPREPWEAPTPDDTPILLLLCANCYVGTHRP